MSDNEPDTEAEEGFTRAGRMMMVGAAQLAQRLLEQRQRDLQEQTAGDLSAARDLEQRIGAERSAVETQLRSVFDDKWWSTAELEDIGQMYATAKAWAPESEYAADAERTVRAELVARYGPEAEAWLDGAATDRQEADKQRQAADRDRGEAAELLADVATDQRHEAAPDSRVADAELAYDSAARRDTTAAALTGRGIDREAVGARMAADVSHAERAGESSGAKNAGPSKARKGRGRSAERSIQER